MCVCVFVRYVVRVGRSLVSRPKNAQLRATKPYYCSKNVLHQVHAAHLSHCIICINYNSNSQTNESLGIIIQILLTRISSVCSFGRSSGEYLI